MATMATIKGSDIGRTVDIRALAEELNNHPNGGFVFISKYENKDGVITDQCLRLCPTNEQRGNGYISAKASDLAKVEGAIADLQAGREPFFGNTLRILRNAKFATAGHKTAKAGEEVSANTKNNAIMMALDYPIRATDNRVMEALLDIRRSIVAPRETGLADYQGEGEKGLYTLGDGGAVRFYLREVYSQFSCESKDENGVVISGYKDKTKGEPVAIKDAIGKALGLRRDKYRTFILAPEKFDTISIAKRVITMDGGAGEFSILSNEGAKDWLGVSVPEEDKDALCAFLSDEPVPVQA